MDFKTIRSLISLLLVSIVIKSIWIRTRGCVHVHIGYNFCTYKYEKIWWWTSKIYRVNSPQLWLCMKMVNLDFQKETNKFTEEIDNNFNSSSQIYRINVRSRPRNFSLETIPIFSCSTFLYNEQQKRCSIL